MAPTLLPGDRLLVDTRAFRKRLPRVGEVIVFADPEAPGRWLVKRVSRVDEASGAVEVRGDAAELSRDSRRFGPLPARLLVGRAYRLYFPPERRREL